MSRARLFFKRTLAVPTVAVRWARPRPRRWVLTFHDVGPRPGALAIEAFADLVGRLAREADLVPLAEALEFSRTRRYRVALTFDDGYAEALDAALPLLGRLGVRPTVFVPTGLLAEDDAVPVGSHRLYPGRALAGWRRLAAWADRGAIDLGSHGVTHRALPALSPAERDAELCAARADVERRSGRPCPYLAYPFGLHDGATADAARAVGYAAAFTTRHGGMRGPQDLWRLPRLDVRSNFDAGDVLAGLRGGMDYLSWLHRRRSG